MRLFGQLHYATMVLYLRRNLTCPAKEQFCLAISSRAVLKSTFPNTRDFCENGNKRWDTHIIIIFLTFVRRIFLHFLITRALNKDIVCAFFYVVSDNWIRRLRNLDETLIISQTTSIKAARSQSWQLTTADLLGPFQQPCPPEYFIRLYLFGSPVHSPHVLKYRLHNETIYKRTTVISLICN